MLGIAPHPHSPHHTRTQPVPSDVAHYSALELSALTLPVSSTVTMMSAGRRKLKKDKVVHRDGSYFVYLGGVVQERHASEEDAKAALEKCVGHSAQALSVLYVLWFVKPRQTNSNVVLSQAFTRRVAWDAPSQDEDSEGERRQERPRG